MKAFMMPHTVPNRPTNGAVAPMVASTPVPRAIRRDIAASTRSSRSAMRSLKPSSITPSDRLDSRAADCTICATASRPSRLSLLGIGQQALALELGQRVAWRWMSRG